MDKSDFTFESTLLSGIGDLRLFNLLAGKVTRKEFLEELSAVLRQYFAFDRLCINLYDNQEELLSYFTTAQGTVIKSLAPVRPANPATTVAGFVIVNRRPIVITDFSQYFPKEKKHPIEEAGLKATIAIPLLLGDEILGTFHCSFAKAPKNIDVIATFLTKLSKILAPCLGAILSMELKSSLPFFDIGSPNAEAASILYKSEAMQDVMHNIKAIAKYNYPVLLLGETGTGKSLLAREIHLHSSRASAHFVKVNCPALSSSLFESELFGHIKGAFTGALNKRIGRFELAHQGTLFLDEIGDLSMEMQSKLLQVLEESRFERVGESTSLSVDMRLISATNVRVEEAIANQSMRADLYHRLSAYVIEVPPLRERKKDIPLLIKAFASEVDKKKRVAPQKLEKWIIEALMSHDWPGNVRELKNIVGRIMIMKKIKKNITPDMVDAILRRPLALSNSLLYPHAMIRRRTPPSRTEPTVAEGKMPTLECYEKRHIIEALELCNWVVSGDKGAAKYLGIPRSTLWTKIKKFGIQLHPGKNAQPV